MAIGHIFDIQRFSIHDGPGIRTTVFLKGCPLRCLWCGNPESISHKPLLSYLADKCIACGECFKVCEPHALSADAAGKAVLDRSRCTTCGKCAPACDAKALEMVGHEAPVAEVMAVVLRDRDYYKTSDGGVTFSGGEPLAQPEYLEALLCAAKAEGLHCTVETSGYAPWSAIAPIVSLVDYWLYDFKEINPELHVKYTGVRNPLILENLQKLHDQGANILVRTPMIPEFNARKEHLDGLVALSKRLPKLLGVELLPYYDLWRGKLKRFGLASELPESVKPPSADTLKSWNDYLRERGVRVIG